MQRLTIERTMIIILMALLFAIATRVPVDTDTWWHIRSGEYTLTQGMIYTDPFSHTFTGEPWINHSWGAQVIMYGLWQIAGNTGLSLFTAVLAVGGIMLLYPIGAGNAYLRAFVLILSAATAAVFWSARPQMLSFFFSTVSLYLLYRYKQGDTRAIWGFPLMMLVWGNLHAGYSIGFIFLFAFFAGEIANRLFKTGGDSVLTWAQIRNLMIAGVLSVAVLVISPYGLDTLLVPFQTVGMDSLRQFIQEWLSPNFQGRETWPFIAMVMALIGAGWISRLPFDFTSYFLTIGTLFMALLYGRNIAVFAVAAAPLLTFMLDNALTTYNITIKSRQRISKTMARLNAGLVAIVVLGVLVYAMGVWLPETVNEAQAQRLPVAAAQWLNENPDLAGQMFNDYDWGGYLMFAAPQYPVFIDGRTDLYNQFLFDYLNAATGGDRWRVIFDTYDIGFAVIRQGSGLDATLASDPAWQIAYADDNAVIYTQTDD